MFTVRDCDLGGPFSKPRPSTAGNRWTGAPKFGHHHNQVHPISPQDAAHDQDRFRHFPQRTPQYAYQVGTGVKRPSVPPPEFPSRHEKPRVTNVKVKHHRLTSKNGDVGNPDVGFGAHRANKGRHGTSKLLASMDAGPSERNRPPSWNWTLSWIRNVDPAQKQGDPQSYRDNGILPGGNNRFEAFERRRYDPTANGTPLGFHQTRIGPAEVSESQTRPSHHDRHPNQSKPGNYRRLSKFRKQSIDVSNNKGNFDDADRGTPVGDEIGTRSENRHVDDNRNGHHYEVSRNSTRATEQSKIRDNLPNKSRAGKLSARGVDSNRPYAKPSKYSVPKPMPSGRQYGTTEQPLHSTPLSESKLHRKSGSRGSLLNPRESEASSSSNQTTTSYRSLNLNYNPDPTQSRLPPEEVGKPHANGGLKSIYAIPKGTPESNGYLMKANGVAAKPSSPIRDDTGLVGGHPGHPRKLGTYPPFGRKYSASGLRPGLPHELDPAGIGGLAFRSAEPVQYWPGLDPTIAVDNGGPMILQPPGVHPQPPFIHPGGRSKSLERLKSLNATFSEFETLLYRLNVSAIFYFVSALVMFVSEVIEINVLVSISAGPQFAGGGASQVERSRASVSSFLYIAFLGLLGAIAMFIARGFRGSSVLSLVLLVLVGVFMALHMLMPLSLPLTRKVLDIAERFTTLDSGPDKSVGRRASLPHHPNNSHLISPGRLHEFHPLMLQSRHVGAQYDLSDPLLARGSLMSSTSGTFDMDFHKALAIQIASMAYVTFGVICLLVSISTIVIAAKLGRLVH